jgi:hypothetical protein
VEVTQVFVDFELELSIGRIFHKIGKDPLIVQAKVCQAAVTHQLISNVKKSPVSHFIIHPRRRQQVIFHKKSVYHSAGNVASNFQLSHGR